MSNPVYDLQQVTKQYPKQKEPANNAISLQIYAGEIFGLLGDNGAGKTTLVRQMANLLRRTAGQIYLFDEPIEADPLRIPRYVGYMPQDNQALNNLTVSEALYFTAHLRGLSRAAARQERDRLLELWQITAIRGQPSSRLSGGQKRLLRLAVAMAGSPPVLILDEPTNDLDPQRRRLVWEILRQVNAQNQTTIIFITHDAIEAEKVIERVGIMRQGQLLAVGRPSDLKQSLDQKLRLELFFNPTTPPALPTGLPVQALSPGRWLVLLQREQASVVLETLAWENIDDFRLYSATLEDLYLHYVDQ